MKRFHGTVFVALFGACSSAPGGAHAPSGGSESDVGASADEGAGEEGGGDDGGLELPPLEVAGNDHFATSTVCVECHSNSDEASAMRDVEGRGVGMWDRWNASMMANSARDPFWWAMMSAEVKATPSAQAVIEQTCMRCHAPMGVHENELSELAGFSAAELRTGSSDAAQFGLDGVACAACHQIQAEGLGEDSSYTGHFVIEAKGEMYGPHDNPFEMPMIHHTGFTPRQASHIESSALCGSCHTLETETLDPSGGVVAMGFPEQMTYLEWRNSEFNDESPGANPRSCGSCHQPRLNPDGTPLVTAIARNPGGFDFPPVEARSPYGQHSFVGANAYMMGVLRDEADSLSPVASTQAFDAMIAETRDMLATRSADLSIGDVTREGDLLVLAVQVQVHTGHKFPSGYPSRRAWLQVEVKDAQGQSVFSSGGFDARGRILVEGKAHPAELAGGPIHAHVEQVSAPEQVPVYESVMQDAQGEATYRLLRAESYAKDNRLLPRGWSTDFEDLSRVAPVGVESDADFGAGGDTVEYRIAAASAAGPYTVEARLLYQTLSPRFAAELFVVDDPVVRAFETFWERSDPRPESVASVTVVAD